MKVIYTVTGLLCILHSSVGCNEVLKGTTAPAGGTAVFQYYDLTIPTTETVTYEVAKGTDIAKVRITYVSGSQSGATQENTGITFTGNETTGSIAFDFANVTSSDIGNYILKNALGDELQCIQLHISGAAPTVQLTGPNNKNEDDSVTFTCTATSHANPVTPLVYSWEKDGVTINGETSSSLNILSAATTDSGEYKCIATEDITGGQSSTSNGISLTVVEKEKGSYGGAIGGGVGGGVGGIVVITIVIIIIRRRMQAVDVEIMDRNGDKVKSTITSHKDGVYLVEFTPTLAGRYTIKISISGKAIPNSPLSVNIGAAHASKAWYTSGLGIQQRGVRVNTKAKFKVHSKGDGDKVECEVISPAGRNIECEIKKSEKEVGVYECHYVPLEEGRYVINIIVDEQKFSVGQQKVIVPKSSFQVDVVPEKTSKLGAYGLEGGVVNQLVCFTVESSAMDDKDQTKGDKTQEDAGNDGGSSCFPRNNSILPICTGTDQQPQPSQGGQGQGGQHTAKGQTKLPPDFARQKPDGDNGKHLDHGKPRPLPIPDKDDGLQKSKTKKSGSVVSKGDVEIDEAPQFPRKLPEIPPGGEKNIRGISANFDEVVPDKKRLTPIGKETIEKYDEESPRKKKKKKKDKGKDTSVEYNTDS